MIKNIGPALLIPVIATLAIALLTLLNGFPLVYHDTAYYLDHALNESAPGTLLYRPLTYSIFMAFSGIGTFTIILQTFWLVLVLQTALSIFEVPRKFVLPVVAAAIVLTPLAWVSNFLLPDIFFSIQILSLFCLWQESNRVAAEKRWFSPLEISLGLSYILAASYHYSNCLLSLGALFLLPFFKRKLRLLVIALLPFLLIPSIHQAKTGSFAWSNAEHIYLFSRLSAVEVSKEYLQENCDEKPSILCMLKETGFNIWNWNPLQVEPMVDDMEEVNTQVLLTWKYLKKVLIYSAGNWFRQMYLFADPLKSSINDSVLKGYLQNFLPEKQKRFENQALASMPREALYSGMKIVWITGFILALIGFFLLVKTKQLQSVHWRFALFFFGALLMNSFLCGVLSEPLDRYQARLMWIFPVFVAGVYFSVRAPKIIEAKEKQRVKSASGASSELASNN